MQRMRLNRDEETGIIIRKVGERHRPLSDQIAQSQPFLTIPKDKESLDEQISSLKKELNYEKRDKALLKAEFNKLREFLGKIKKDKINEARKIPERPKTASKKNSDLSGVIEGNNTSIVDKQNEGDSSKHRLKIQQLKEKIEEIEKLNKAQEDQIAKLKSKGLGETEYSSKLRKDLLKAHKIIEGLKNKMEKEKIFFIK